MKNLWDKALSNKWTLAAATLGVLVMTSGAGVKWA